MADRNTVAMMTWLDYWKRWARDLKIEAHTLCLAYRDPRTPWYAKLMAGLVAAYALSPIDLIPDPIPVLGYLDDLILLPLGVLLARKLIPDDVLRDCRQKAETLHNERPTSRLAAVVIVAIWLIVLAGLFYFFTRLLWDS